MIQSLRTTLKRIFKIFAWLTFSVILLLLCLIFAIRIPAVQQAILSKTIAYLERKTHSEIKIKTISLTFPVSVQLDGILVKDLQQDTLVSAGEILVSLDMYRLFKKEIEINRVFVSNALVNLQRSQKDSLFNFNFLISAFSDTTKVIEKKSPKRGKTNLMVKEVEMENIRFIYNDQYQGIYTSNSFTSLRLSLDKLGLENQQYGINELLLSGLRSELRVSKKTASKNTATEKTLPYISVKKVELKNCAVSFIDQIANQSVISVVSDLSLTNSSINLNTQKIKGGTVYLRHSNIKVNLSTQTQIRDKNIPSVITKQVNKGWVIAAEQVILENNAIGYNIINLPAKKDVFDPNHINYSKVSLNSEKLFYSEDKIFANVNTFSAKDPASFEVENFSTKFLMTRNSIRAMETKLKTKGTSFSGNASLGFNSLNTIKDSLTKLKLMADIRSSSISPSEIIYFAPTLSLQAFFRNNIRTSVTGVIAGTVGKLNAKNLRITTAHSTALHTNITITGLPKIKTAHFDVNKMILTTGKDDIKLLLGDKIIPNTIQLPAQINLTGDFKGYLSEFTAHLTMQSSLGDIQLQGDVDKNENFKGFISAKHFDLGLLLNNREMFGPVTLTADVKGQGLDTHTVKATVNLTAPEFYLNRYTYHNLDLAGTYSKKIAEGNLNVNDTNLAVKLDAFINLNSGSEQYKVTLNLEGADLKKLKLTEQDLKIAFRGICDLKGKDMNTVNGTAGIKQIIIASKGKKYILDSLIFAAINETGNAQMSITSAIVGIKYKGTFAPGDLVKELKQNLNHYFPIPNAETVATQLKGAQQFSFDVTVNNHPILSEVFFPDLKEFEPGKLSGSFNSEKKQLQLNLSVDRLLYKDYDFTAIAFESNSDEKSLTYKLTSKKIADARFKFDNVIVEGKLEGGQATTHLSSTEENDKKKLVLNTVLVNDNGNYKLSIDPKEFFMMYEQWAVSEDNYISFGKEGLLFHNVSLTQAQKEIYANTPSAKLDGDILAGLKNFKLDDLSRIVEKDTGLVKGTVNGTISLRKIKSTYAFESDLLVSDLSLHEIRVGNLSVKANNNIAEQYHLKLTLAGEGNNVNAEGQYTPANKDKTLALKLNMQPLTARSLEAFSFGKVKEASGDLYSDLNITGTTASPEVSGTLRFENVTLTPAFLNSPLFLRSETIQISPDGFTFNSFTMLDKNQNPAVVNGNVGMKHFKDFKFGLNVSTNNFLLLSTTKKDNEQYFGTMIIDSRIRIKGTPDFPVINSNIKLKNGSYFTFAVTETKLTTDKGEGVVLFVDSMKFNRILTRNENREKKKSAIRNFDISSTIEIDKKASICLMLDPGTNDSLVVRGDAALSFALDPSGKVSLTGVYNVTEGSYVVSLENVIKKKFKIEPGSTITWNGDPLDAIVNISATYYVRATPIDLVAGQVSGSELDSYRQRYPFLIYLKLRGPILTPNIAFELQLQQGDKGAAGGSINAKLEQLNDNPSALNKQVFALLVLNRFVQENPLQTETNASENAARTTVGKILSAQLNQLSSKIVPGVDVNFDVQSYDDYSSGKSEGRTQVGVGVSKQLFNERLSVQVGGAVDVEGEKAKQNNATDITGDVILEYKLTKDGRYRLKGFRNNQYQGALEGQIIQTGAGIIYVRDFNEWIQLLTRVKKDTIPVNQKNLNVDKK
ncbi:MAG: translocation/assembly module TamB domain-containing protein [Bacteroidetes bacterium]|nr:translocation/assembly module TamB domain-containing protein [Bacteroidota bacterium]